MQQINLYTIEFQPRQQYLSLRNVALSIGAILVLGIVIGSTQTWRTHALTAQINALQNALDAEKASMAADQAQLDARQPTPELVAELEKLNGEAAAKQELLASLQNAPLADRQGYSRILKSLASHPFDGLWIANIAIDAGNVDIGGFSRDAKLVPSFVDTLVKDVDFGPRNYQVFALKADEHGLLSFELRGHRDRANAP